MNIDFETSFELYRLGKYEMDKGCFTEAVNNFQKSISIFPHFKTLELLGESLLHIGKPIEAIPCLAASVTLGQNQFSRLLKIASI